MLPIRVNVVLDGILGGIGMARLADEVVSRIKAEVEAARIY